VQSAAIAINLADVLPIKSFKALKYPTYVSCLVAGFMSEVPIAVDGKCVFLSIDKDIEGIPGTFRQIIVEMRHLLHWKQIWKSGAWNERWEALLEQTVGYLDGIVREQGSVLALLHECETKAIALTSTIAGTSDNNSLAEQVREVLFAGDANQALAMANRYLGSALLSDSEKKPIAMHKISATIAINDHKGAADLIKVFQARPNVTSTELLAVATWFYEMKEYKKASSALVGALDKGLRLRDAKEVGLAIAGKTGDKMLAKRLLANGE
jgi:hypothetical protein